MVASQTRRRWALVALGLAALVAAPTGVPAARSALVRADAREAGTTGAEQLLARALASAGVPHEATAETRGTLGLPDLPRLGGVAGLLGGTTRTRVWWSGEQAWRVDTTTATGEQGDYGVGDDVVTWDYERDTLALALGAARDGVRLPRAADLLPPQATRRVLGSVGPGDRLSGLGGRLVAGRAATGLQAVPGDGRSTIARVEVWVDDATGLPLELVVRGTDGRDALSSRYLDVSLGEPAAAVLAPPTAPGARREAGPGDVVAVADLRSPWALPSELAGLPSARQGTGGTAVYGRGLTRFVVVPVTSRLAGEVLSAARRGGAVALDLPRGESELLGTPLVNLVVARGDDRMHAYVVAGLVEPGVLEDAARALLADPPPRRAVPRTRGP